MFYSIEELVQQSHAYSSIADLMITIEMENSGRDRKEIRTLMERNLQVMEQSVEKGINGVHSVTGLTGDDAKRLNSYLDQDDFLSGSMILKAVRNAIAVNEVNASMGLVCATPTAGSAGVVPGVLMACREPLGLTRDRKSVV